MIIVINLFINLFEFVDLYQFYLSCFFCRAWNIISFMRRIVLFAFQKPYFFSFFRKCIANCCTHLILSVFCCIFFFIFLYFVVLFTWLYIRKISNAALCPIYYIPKIALYFRHHVYSYTAAFHSQLPFFFVYLFFSSLILFSFLIFFYFDFPLYNKHRRIRRKSRKTVPNNAHFHFHFSHSPHIHEETQFWAVFETYFWVSTHTARASSRSALVFVLPFALLCFAFAFAFAAALAPTDIRTRPSFMNVWRWRPQPCEFYLAAVGSAAQWSMGNCKCATTAGYLCSLIGNIC